MRVDEGLGRRHCLIIICYEKRKYLLRALFLNIPQVTLNLFASLGSAIGKRRKETR